jgi:hypothetical protein
MWLCPRCRERHEEHFEVCWACGAPRGYSDVPDQVTCDGTRWLSPTEAEERAAREAVQKKALPRVSSCWCRARRRAGVDHGRQRTVGHQMRHGPVYVFDTALGS